MKKKIVTLSLLTLGTFLAAFLLTQAAIRAYNTRLPDLSAATVIEESYIVCLGDIIIFRSYNLFGSEQWREAVTLSVERDGKQVILVYIEFPKVDADARASRIVVIPEDESPMEMTMDELQETYSHPCQLLKLRT